MGKADLHIHSRVSDGLATIDQILDYVEHHTDFDVIAITDHEDVTGGLRARDAAARRGLRTQVVPGVEITTLSGHLLALFVERAPRSFRGLERTLEDIHSQGGLAVIPHPLSWLTRSLGRRTIDRIVGRAEPGITFDGIELANPSPAGRLTGGRAAALNGGWGIAPVGGSDAHHLEHLGSAWTEFEGTTPEALKEALAAGKVTPGTGHYASLRTVGLGRAALGLIWGYAATPRKMLRLRPHSRGHP